MGCEVTVSDDGPDDGDSDDYTGHETLDRVIGYYARGDESEPALASWSYSLPGSDTSDDDAKSVLDGFTQMAAAGEINVVASGDNGAAHVEGTCDDFNYDVIANSDAVVVVGATM